MRVTKLPVVTVDGDTLTDEQVVALRNALSISYDQIKRLNEQDKYFKKATLAVQVHIEALHSLLGRK